MKLENFCYISQILLFSFIPFSRPLTHGGGLVIARVPLLARCGGVVCLLA
jgi:hypothetical protein